MVSSEGSLCLPCPDLGCFDSSVEVACFQTEAIREHGNAWPLAPGQFVLQMWLHCHWSAMPACAHRMMLYCCRRASCRAQAPLRPGVHGCWQGKSTCCRQSWRIVRPQCSSWAGLTSVCAQKATGEVAGMLSSTSHLCQGQVSCPTVYRQQS